MRYLIALLLNIQTLFMPIVILAAGNDPKLYMTPAERVLEHEPDEWKAAKFRAYLGSYFNIITPPPNYSGGLSELAHVIEEHDGHKLATILKLFIQKSSADNYSLAMHQWQNGKIEEIFVIPLKSISHEDLSLVETTYKYNIEVESFKVFNDVLRSDDYSKIYIAHKTLTYKLSDYRKIRTTKWANLLLSSLNGYSGNPEVSAYSFINGDYLKLKSCSLFFN